MRLFYRKPFSLCCFFLICGALVGFFAESRAVLCVAAVLFFAAVVSCITAFAKGRRASFFTVTLPLLFAVFGAVYFMAYTDRIGNTIEKYTREDSHSIEAVVISRSFVSNYLSIYDVRTSKLDGENVNIKMRFEVPFFLELEGGDVVRASVTLSDFDNSDGFDQKQYYNSKGYFFLAEWESGDIVCLEKKSSPELTLSKLRSSLADVFYSGLDEEHAGLFTAVFLGDRSGLSDTAKRDFRRTGGYHLLALSGMHLSVFTAIVGAFMSLLGIKKGKRYAVLTLVIVFYVALTGFHLSMVRSAIMLLAVYLGYYLRARGDSLTSLTFAAAVIIVFSPQSIGDIGFWMSVLATFGIIIATPLETLARFKLRKIERVALRKAVSYISTTLIISFSAILMILPFSCFCFHAISLVGPIVTLALSGMVSIVLLLAPLTLLLFRIPVVSDLLFFLCGLVSRFILSTANLFSELENIYVSLEYDFVKYLVIPFFIVFAVMLLADIKHKRIIPVFVIVWLLLFSSFEYFALNDPAIEAEYLRRGKNEYFCLSASGDNILIDISDGSFSNLSRAGSESARKGFCELDAVVLTHLHKRHISSLARLASTQMLRKVLLPEPQNSSESEIVRSVEYEMALHGVKVVYYGEDDIISVCGVRIKAEHAYIKRSTHPVIKLDMGERLDITYIGSSYPEYRDAQVSEATFFGIHGPVCKNEFEADAAEAELVVFANETLFSFAKINLGDRTELVKNANIIRLSE